MYLPLPVLCASQKPENGTGSQDKKLREAGFGIGLSHLDALIDAAHYPVEEAAVDILSQGIPSILSLGCGAVSLMWQPQDSLKSQGLQEGSYLHDIQNCDHLFFGCLHGS